MGLESIMKQARDKEMGFGMKQARDERRFRQLLVTPELLAHLGSGTFRVTDNALPPDAEVVSGAWDAQRYCHAVLIVHPSFDPVPLGAPIPIHSPPMITRLEDQEPR